MTEAFLIALAVVQASLAAGLILKGIDLARRAKEAQRRISDLEDRIAELAASEARPLVASAKSLAQRVSEIRNAAARAHAASVPQTDDEVDPTKWIHYVPKMIDIIVSTSSPDCQKNVKEKASHDVE